MNTFILKEGKNNFVKLGLKLGIVVAILVIIAIGTMIYGLVKAGSWAMVHVPKSPIIQNAPASLFDKIKNVFNDEDDNTSSQTIKVVNEESQVISVVEKTSPAVVSI